MNWIPVDGSYVSDILPASWSPPSPRRRLHSCDHRGHAGVDQDKAGLAAGLLNTGQQLGAALGLAILSALATAHTNSLPHAGQDSVAQASTHGYQRALMAGAGFVLAAGAVALLARNSRQTRRRSTSQPERVGEQHARLPHSTH